MEWTLMSQMFTSKQISSTLGLLYLTQPHQLMH